MLAAKVIKRREQRGHRRVVVHRLAVGIGPSGVAADVHPHRQIEPLASSC
jgi:hypothetical protein